MLRLFSTALAFTAIALPAFAAPFAYLDFVTLPTQQRALYVAGAYDQFVTIYAPPVPDGSGYQDFVQHIAACVSGTGLDPVAMQAGLMAFAVARPDLQAGPIPILLMEYLIAECGLPDGGQAQPERIRIPRRSPPPEASVRNRCPAFGDFREPVR
jgi:hypothetical protein